MGCSCYGFYCGCCFGGSCFSVVVITKYKVFILYYYHIRLLYYYHIHTFHKFVNVGERIRGGKNTSRIYMLQGFEMRQRFLKDERISNCSNI